MINQTNTITAMSTPSSSDRDTQTAPGDEFVSPTEEDLATHIREGFGHESGHESEESSGGGGGSVIKISDCHGEWQACDGSMILVEFINLKFEVTNSIDNCKFQVVTT